MADDFRHLRLDRDTRGVATVSLDVQGVAGQRLQRRGVPGTPAGGRATRTRPAAGGGVPQREAVRVPGRGGRPPDPAARVRNRGADGPRRGAGVVRPRRAAAVPDGRGHPRAVPGRRAGARARLPSPRRPRRRADQDRVARGDARAHTRLGRHAAVAAARRLAAGTADDPRRRDAQRAEGRRGGAGRSRGAARRLRCRGGPVPRRSARGEGRLDGRAVVCSAPCSMAPGRAGRWCSRTARKRIAKRGRDYPALPAALRAIEAGLPALARRRVRRRARRVRPGGLHTRPPAT